MSFFFCSRMAFTLLTLVTLMTWASEHLQANTLARFRSPLGEVEVELFDQDKPITVQNFIRYVQSGAYTNHFMHRWVPNFVIQGGGFHTVARGGSNTIEAISVFPPVLNEFDAGARLSNTYGTLAMARASGQTNSATSQWFFNLANNSGLDSVDGGFTVFGRVLRGTNVLNRFNNTSRTNSIYRLQLQPPLNELPVLSPTPSYNDLVYTDITLLTVQLKLNARRGREISWLSVQDKVNHLEFATQLPPQWQVLSSINGTGNLISITDPDATPSFRMYRVRVDY